MTLAPIQNLQCKALGTLRDVSPTFTLRNKAPDFLPQLEWLECRI